MDDGNGFWRSLASVMSERVFITMLVGMIYVYQKSGRPTRLGRAIEAGASGMLAWSVGPDVARLLHMAPEIAVLLVSTLGFLVLDVTTSLLADRDMLREILIRRFGGRQK